MLTQAWHQYKKADDREEDQVVTYYLLGPQQSTRKLSPLSWENQWLYACMDHVRQSRLRAKAWRARIRAGGATTMGAGQIQSSDNERLQALRYRTDSIHKPGARGSGSLAWRGLAFAPKQLKPNSKGTIRPAGELDNCVCMVFERTIAVQMQAYEIVLDLKQERCRRLEVIVAPRHRMARAKYIAPHKSSRSSGSECS